MQSSAHNSQHESEWVYSTTLSKKLLSPLNDYIHDLPSVSLPTELFVGACGYAFNPVLFPFWFGLIYALTYRELSLNSSSLPASKWWIYLSSLKQEYGAIVNTAMYLTSVLITLAFTEIGKASFATTRPNLPPDGYNSKNNSAKWIRRYGQLVASLKSKHSFPSGDSAQAMNLCMFLSRYIPTIATTMLANGVSINFILFGMFLPGVPFARVFYRCHWVEDCIGGVLLSWVLHLVLMPAVATKITVVLAPLLAFIQEQSS